MQFKKFYLLLAFSFFTFLGVQAQSRYAVINTKYILDKIPEYKEADKKLKTLGDQWQAEIDEKQMVLDKMYKNYEAEQFMLSDDLKKKLSLIHI
jgi:outer membrane protein